MLTWVLVITVKMVVKVMMIEFELLTPRIYSVYLKFVS